MRDDHARLLRLTQRRATDFRPWGDADREGDDCSCGCVHARPLAGRLGADWLVCSCEDGPRAGLLTFEHQGGAGCFETTRMLRARLREHAPKEEP